MRRINRLLNRISLVGKIVIIFLGCAMIPFILQLVFYISETEKNIQAEMYEKMTDALSNTATRLEASVADVMTLAAKYNNDMRLYQTMDIEYESDIQYLIAYQDNVQQTIKADMPLHLQIDGITFITDNPSIFGGSTVQRVVPFDRETLGETYLDHAIYPISGRDAAYELRVGVRHVPHQRMNVRTVSISRALSFYTLYSDHPKIVNIELNPAHFNSIISGQLGLFSNMLIVDAEQRVLFSANTFNQNSDFDRFDRANLEKGAVALEVPLDQLPMTLLGIYDSTMIADQFTKSIAGVGLITLIGIAIAAFFVLVIGNNLSGRTRAIVRKSEQIAQGNFTAATADLGEPGGDEIAQIEKSIHQMSLQLTAYIDREYTAKLTQSRLEQETTQAKLMALQSQVNPHFLFNALESIRLNAIDKDKSETVQMIKRMSKMFRYLVDWDEDIIRLEKELSFLNEFLSIQKYRFGDEFTYEITVAEAAKACLMPKLILQPLVENACVHGVEATSNAKRIQIDVQAGEGRIRMRVEDNGGGLSPEKLAQARAVLQGGPRIGHSVGLYNVYQRLLLHYKNDFTFTIDSWQGLGTVCMVTIPLRYEGDSVKEEGSHVLRDDH
ncbi:MAG: sensor histidine kinase [Oscillospiraceae bacterium]|jgi:two-component system sensor histidine kinase YesM|nr:sensor histidine kinase [Oscillospiraceae bacterium]